VDDNHTPFNISCAAEEYVNGTHSRAFKRARRQRHYVNPPMSDEHQSANEEPSEHETINHSDGEEIETCSHPSPNSILRKPQSHPPSPSPLASPPPQLPRSEPSEHEASNYSDNEDIETSSLPSLNLMLRRPQSPPLSPSPLASPPPHPSPLASPPPQLPKSKRCRQEPEPEPSQPPRKTRRNVKSKYVEMQGLWIRSTPGRPPLPRSSLLSLFLSGSWII